MSTYYLLFKEEAEDPLREIALRSDDPLAAFDLLQRQQISGWATLWKDHILLARMRRSASGVWEFACHRRLEGAVDGS